MKTAPSSFVVSRFVRQSVRISVALALAGALIFVGYGRAFGKVGSQQAAQYSCGHRCYGTTTWSTTAEYAGASTDIQLAQFHCGLACTGNLGSIDNEMWLLDENSPACQQTAYQQCWVEAGYLMNHTSPYEVFFWYDQRPNQNPAWGIVDQVGPAPSPVQASPTVFLKQSTVTATPPPPTATVPPNDYGTSFHFMIIKDSRLTPCSPSNAHTAPSFLIFMYNDTTIHPLGGVSNCNPMTAQYIRIGQELHGSGGATADPATFTHNLFSVQPLSSQNTTFFMYNVQTQKGPETVSDNPPMGSWDADPATTLDGGVFSTHCC